MSALWYLTLKQSEISESCNFVMCVKNLIRLFHTMVNKIEEEPNRVFLKHVPVFPGFCFLNLSGLSIRVFHPLPSSPGTYRDAHRW